MWSATEYVLKNLCTLGFNDQFFNAEFFIFSNGHAKMVEINSRMTALTAKICTQVMTHGDVFYAAAQIAQGVKPRKPVYNGNVFGCRCFLTTHMSGVTRDFLNFSYLSSMSNADISIAEDAVICPSRGEEGFCMGYIDVYGQSLQECFDQMEELKFSVFKTMEGCPWFE